MKKLILLLLFIPFVFFGQKKSNNNLFSEKESSEKNNPFLDCEINDNSCFKNLVNQHVFDNFIYPDLGHYFDVQAIVYADYTVDNEGVVKNVSCKAALIGVSFEDLESKNIMSSTFEKAASLIIENLPKINPAIIEGVAVSKKFRTPILYKLNDIEKGQITLLNVNKINEGQDFLNNFNENESQINEEVPVFPGCEEVKESEKRNCLQVKMFEHVRVNFRYPEFAQKNNIQGRVFTQFIIGVDGNVSKIRTRGPNKILEREAERIFLLLPTIKPGRINGLRVNVPISMPVTFRLRK